MNGFPMGEPGIRGLSVKMITLRQLGDKLLAAVQEAMTTGFVESCVFPDPADPSVAVLFGGIPIQFRLVTSVQVDQPTQLQVVILGDDRKQECQLSATLTIPGVIVQPAQIDGWMQAQNVHQFALDVFREVLNVPVPFLLNCVPRSKSDVLAIYQKSKNTAKPLAA